MVKKILKGGDGYSLNANQPIGGLLGFTRYSNNYQPVFEGELLQNGGDGYSTNVSKEVGGQPVYTRYTDEQSGGGDCGCDSHDPKDPSIFDLIKLTGGNKNNISQFDAIRELSYRLAPISINKLLDLNVNIFLTLLHDKKPNKTKQLGGYVSQLKDIIAPLGKNNLLVLSSLLLLHYFAVEKQTNNKTKVLKGGDSDISLLTNSLESSLLLLLKQAFKLTNNKKIQSGGNPLKDLIAPLGTNAFIATGLLILLEKLFTSSMNEVKKNKNNLIGGKINKNYEKLFNLIAPLTFNTFAKKSFLDNLTKNKILNK
jgi:hypothetical protein